MSDTLSVMGFSQSDQVAKARIAEFRRQAPRVALRLIDGPVDDTEFLAAVAAGDSPDLVYVDRDLIGGYAARGAIVPLDEYIERAQIDVREFRDAALRHVSFRGAQYGIPEFYDIQVLFINVAALVSADLAPGEIEFGDWKSLPVANRALTRRVGGALARVGVDPGLPDLLPVWAKANGADLLSNDGRTARFDDPLVVEALEKALAMIADQGGWVALADLLDRLDPFGPENPIARDQVGVMAMDAGYVDVLAEQSPHLQFIVKPLVDRRGMALTYSHGMAWAIASGARNPTQAIAFARTMVSPEAWVAGARARATAARDAGRRFEAMYTANKVADHAIWMTVYEPSGQPVFDAAAQVIRSIQETGFVVPPNAAPREVRAAWMSGAKRALRGEHGPARAMKEANRIAQTALDAAG